MNEVCGLLLAAGAGRRMGGPKALLRDPDGVPRLSRTVGRLLDGGCDEVLVVLGAEADEARALLDGTGSTGDRPWAPGAVRTVVAEDWETGMSASLHTGLAALEEADPGAVVVHLVDLPDVGAAVVERVVASWRGAGADPSAVARASYDGRPGHPVLLGRAHHAPLAAALAAAGAATAGLPADEGARTYLADRRVHLVDCSDLATGRDTDSPEDLR